jgi:hypothetical protein
VALDEAPGKAEAEGGDLAGDLPLAVLGAG